MSDEFGLRSSLRDRARRIDGDGPAGLVWLSPRLIVGLAIVVLGSLLLLDNLNLIEADPIYRYFFPGVLLAVGVSVLVQGSIWGWVWIVGGAWVLAERLEYIELNFFQLFFPAALLLVGGSLVYRTFARPSTATPGPEDAASYIRAFAVMSGNERRGIASTFRRGDLAAFMGGVTLDLRQAKMTPEGAVLDTFAFWGGIEIKVPETWQVRGEVLPLMGGFEDKTRPKTGAVEGTLVIRGFAIMGGVEVSN
ncbi:MAG: hypothetical protein ABIV06_00895 [Thermoanaerobaculia bacterium]